MAHEGGRARRSKMHSPTEARKIPVLMDFGKKRDLSEGRELGWVNSCVFSQLQSSGILEHQDSVLLEGHDLFPRSISFCKRSKHYTELVHMSSTAAMGEPK